MKLLLPLLFLGALGACDDEPPSEAPILITLSSDPVTSQCPSNLCSDYDMSCGAVFMLRYTDPGTGEVLRFPNGTKREVCLAAEANDNLCSLSTLLANQPALDVPQENVRVEVAIWEPGQLSNGSGESIVCPDATGTELFDAFGRPQSNFPDHIPQPAFAGAAYFRAGEEVDVTVALSCPNPDRLSDPRCAANLPTDVIARVSDIETLLDVSESQAQALNLFVGTPREVSDGQGGTIAILDSGDNTKLDLNTSNATPIFEGSVNGSLEGIVCTLTLEDTPQATSTAVCSEVPEGSDDLLLDASLVSKELVDELLTAMALPSFPSEGMVLGRVVDRSLRPASGVSVLPSDGAVLYLSEDMSSVTPVQSTASGYFVSTNVPFGSTWTASHPDGRRQSETPIGGLIQGRLSVVLIVLTDVVGG